MRCVISGRSKYFVRGAGRSPWHLPPNGLGLRGDKKTMRNFSYILVLVLAVGCSRGGDERRNRGERVAPVEVASITRGPIALRRSFSGSLEPRAAITIGAKLTARVERLPLDIGDPVKRGQTVAQLETGDLRQAVASAEADLAVERASYQAAIAERDRATRNLERLEGLHTKKVIAESQLDEAKAAALAAKARVDEAAARVARAKSELAGAKIRLSYTQVQADWPDGDDTRVVAERFVDPGDLVTANSPIYHVVEVDPITASFFVTERDYPRLAIGQTVTLATDAHPGVTFSGEVERLSPVFAADSRQARVEVRIANEEGLLRPGMFVRATVELESLQEATRVPANAIVRRDGKDGVFRLTDAGDRVEWREVTVGIKEGEMVQILGELEGKVVTLGQQLIEDGSKIKIPTPETPATAAAR